MGYDGYGIDGALYGFKTDLLKMLRDGEVPGWLGLSRRRKRSFERNKSGRATPANYLANEVDDPFVRKHGLIEFQFGTNRTVDTKDVDVAATPALIAEKCRDWLESNRDWIESESADGQSFVEFRYFTLMVCVGERGGINDVYVSAKFKNH